MHWSKCYPGQIVYIKHTDEFLKQPIGHPYVVFQHQGFNSRHKKNIICFRITTNLNYMDNKLLIKPTKQNGLDRTSAIVYDAEHLFNVEDATYFGELESSVFEKLIRLRCDYFRQQLKEARTSLENMKKRNL